jgi:hypothetical protein
MGVITANRGISRGTISYNLLKSRSYVFIANNIATDITKNIINDSTGGVTGIFSNNISNSIIKNTSSRITQNTCKAIGYNIGVGRIQSNQISNGTIDTNIITNAQGINNNIIYGNIRKNIAQVINSNGGYISNITGNFVSGSIRDNTCNGEITNNYVKDILTNI